MRANELIGRRFVIGGDLIYFILPDKFNSSKYVNITWYQKDGHARDGQSRYYIGDVERYLEQGRWTLLFLEEGEDVSNYSIF